MDSKQLEKITEVKVIKRYSKSIIFTLFLTFFLIFLPLSQLFFIAISLDVNNAILSEIPSSQSIINFTGLDVINGGFDLFNLRVLKHSDVYLNTFGRYFDKIISNLGSDSVNVGIPFVIISFLVLLFIEFTIAALASIAFFDMLFFGKLHIYKAPKNFAFWMFFAQMGLFGTEIALFIFSCKGGNFEYNLNNLMMPIIYMFSMIVIFALLLVIYHVCFKGGVYMRKLDKVDVNEDRFAPKTEKVYYANFIGEKKEIKQETNVSFPRGLPKELSEIKNQEFTADIHLEIAIIPDGIDSIGNSAFANCINLEVVSIPKTVTKIGYNAFFNCCSLKRINFAGSKEEWKLIKKGSNYLTKAGTCVIFCRNGKIIVNSNK